MLKATLNFECESGDVQNFCTTVNDVLARVLQTDKVRTEAELTRAQGESREKIIHGIGDIVRQCVPAVSQFISSKYGMRISDDELNDIIIRKIGSVVPEMIGDFLKGLKKEIGKRPSTSTTAEPQTESVTSETVESENK